MTENVHELHTAGGDSAGDQLIQATLAGLNNRFAYVMYGGKARVYDQRKDEFFAPGEWNKFARLPRVPVKNGNGTKYVDNRVYWEKHFDQRREYREGIVFEPGTPQANLPDKLNVWRGWGVDPVQGKDDLIRLHLLNVVCAGEREVYEYLLNALAYGVQNPNKKCPVAIVIRGGQGTGKSLVSDLMTRIYGENHSFWFSDPKMLVGDFSGHLQGKQLLCVEEAFFSGDKAGAGRLKDIITNPRMTIHPKGLTPFTVPNLTRIIVTANHEHVLLLENDDRRWLVLETDDRQAKKKAYFEPLWKQIEGGGTAAFFDHLLRRDLSRFSPNQEPPTTKAKKRQVGISLTDHDAWWMECLKDGKITGGAGGLLLSTADWQAGPHKIENAALAESYNEYADRHRFFRGNGSNLLTRKLKKYGVRKDCPPTRRFMLRDLQSERNAFFTKHGVSSFEELE